MSKLETNTIDTVSGTTNLVIGSTNSSTVTFESGSPTGHMYPAFEAKRSSAQTLSHDTETKVAVDVEVFDTAGAYDASTNYRFTPQTAGKYYIYAQAVGETAASQLKRYSLIIKRNGSNYKYMSNYFTNNEAYINNIFIGAVIDFNGSSDYVELFAKIEYASSGTVKIDGGVSGPTFGGYRIGA
jgi:hypothetical protein